MKKRTHPRDAADGEPAFLGTGVSSAAHRQMKRFVASVFSQKGRPLLVGVLGPSTSSVEAARYLKGFMPLHTSVQIVSFVTFEELFTAITDDSLPVAIDLAVVPHAAPIVNKFYMAQRLYPALLFPFSTPTYGLATSTGKDAPVVPGKIAIFPTTLPVLNTLLPDYAASGFELLPVSSTGAAAEMVALGLADYAVTNEEAMKEFGLQWKMRFGKIPMCWTVFARSNPSAPVSAPRAPAPATAPRRISGRLSLPKMKMAPR